MWYRRKRPRGFSRRRQMDARARRAARGEGRPSASLRAAAPGHRPLRPRPAPLLPRPAAIAQMARKGRPYHGGILKMPRERKPHVRLAETFDSLLVSEQIAARLNRLPRAYESNTIVLIDTSYSVGQGDGRLRGEEGPARHRRLHAVGLDAQRHRLQPRRHDVRIGRAPRSCR